MAFDFDYWKNLYETDRVEYEKQRIEYVQSEISNMPVSEDKKQRMRAICWAYEQKLRKCVDDKDRLNQVVSLFWEQFFKFQASIKP